MASSLMKATEVAQLLGKPVQAIHAWIKNGTFPGGFCYKKPDAKRYTYEVSRKIFTEVFETEKSEEKI